MVAAMAAVAAFEAVGSIIAIAMFICPPAAARLMTDSLLRQIGWSALFATLSANLGYIVAGYGPGWFGLPNAVSAAGMIATLSGIILAACCLWAPRRRGNNQALA
jgi:manganese/zinc/iron transport system permease protein